jgi:hypothetical protein
MRQRHSWSRTAQRALIVIVLAAAFSGCQSPPKTTPTCVLSDEDFHGHVASVEARARELDLSESASVPDDLRERHRGAARSFLASLNEYTSALDELETRASALEPMDVARSTTRLARLRGDLARASYDAKEARNAVLGLYEILKAAADGGESIPGLESAPAYISASAQLSALLAEFDDYLASRHLRGLRAAGLDASPAIVILHVVSLARFAELDLHEHAERYHQAWRAWMRSATRGRDFATALEVYEIAATGQGSLRVHSVQELTEIAPTCVRGDTGLAALARMDKALGRLDVSLARKSNPPAGWDRTAKLLRAALLLARTTKTHDTRRKIEFATKARAISNDFPAASAKIFAIAAYALGSEAAGERRFIDSVLVYRQTLEAGSVEDIDYYVARFRSAVFRRALDSVTEDLLELEDALLALSSIHVDGEVDLSPSEPTELSKLKDGPSSNRQETRASPAAAVDTPESGQHTERDPADAADDARRVRCETSVSSSALQRVRNALNRWARPRLFVPSHVASRFGVVQAEECEASLVRLEVTWPGEEGTASPPDVFEEVAYRVRDRTCPGRRLTARVHRDSPLPSTSVTT